MIRRQVWTKYNRYDKSLAVWNWPIRLTLIFAHVTQKLLGIIYSLRTTPVPSLVVIKRRGQKILSGQHVG